MGAEEVIWVEDTIPCAFRRKARAQPESTRRTVGKDTQDLLAGRLKVDWIRSHPQVRKSVLRSRISPTRRRKTSQKPSTQAKRLTECLEPRARRLSLAGA